MGRGMGREETFIFHFIDAAVRCENVYTDMDGFILK